MLKQPRVAIQIAICGFLCQSYMSVSAVFLTVRFWLYVIMYHLAGIFVVCIGVNV